MQTLIYILDLFGVAIFAITGSLAAGRKKMDLFGVVILATVTVLGGGTLRDLLLGTHPVFWVSTPIYLFTAVLAAIASFFLIRFFRLPLILLSVADAFGLAIFTVIGTQKALEFGISPGVAIVMGVMTGVVGGMVRDVLSGEIPLILCREIYATASLCGAIIFIIITTMLKDHNFAVLASVSVTLVLRLSAIRWNISLPLFIPNEDVEK